MEGPTLEDMFAAFEKAAADGNDEEAQFFATEIKAMQARLEANSAEKTSSINKAATQAMADTKTDVGGAAGIPQPLVDFGTEATRQIFNAITPGEGMSKEDFENVDLGEGFVHMGRGVDNLVKGGKQIGIGIREGMGFIDEDQASAERSEINRQRLSEEEPYQNLVKKSPNSATVGRLVGETAPFAAIPVPAIKGLSIPFLGALSRAAPEALAGAAEASIPYVPEDKSREGNAAAGAGGALAGRGLGNLASRAVNAAKGKFLDPVVEEMHALGRTTDVPVNRGSPEAQLEAADAAVSRRTGPDGESGRLADDVIDQQTSRRAELGQEYDELFTDLDSAAVQFAPGSGIGRMKQDVSKLVDSEMAKGGHQNPELMKEYNRWLDTPNNTTIEGLHRFRSNLRKRIRGLPDDAGYSEIEFNQLEDTITKQMHDMAEAISPDAGAYLKRVDQWYFEDVAKLNRIPQIRQLFGDDPKPDRVMKWFLGGKADDVTGMKKKVFGDLSPEGKQAVVDSIWNEGYTKAARGETFKPLNFANYAESKVNHLKNLGAGAEEIAEVENVAKLMRHISKEGKAVDTSLWRLLRGVPFVYRNATDMARRNNLRQRLHDADPSMRPGSPTMDKWYRGIIRGIMINQPEATEATFGTLQESGDALSPSVEAAADQTLGRLSSN